MSIIRNVNTGSTSCEKRNIAKCNLHFQQHDTIFLLTRRFFRIRRIVRFVHSYIFEADGSNRSEWLFLPPNYRKRGRVSSAIFFCLCTPAMETTTNQEFNESNVDFCISFVAYRVMCAIFTTFFSSSFYDSFGWCSSERWIDNCAQCYMGLMHWFSYFTCILYTTRQRQHRRLHGIWITTTRIQSYALMIMMIFVPYVCVCRRHTCRHDQTEGWFFFSSFCIRMPLSFAARLKALFLAWFARNISDVVHHSNLLNVPRCVP